jgi:hypothetical protein
LVVASLLFGCVGAAAQTGGATSLYRLPYDHADQIKVSQGNSQGDHQTPWSQWAFDFAKPGAEFTVLASRAGTVIGARGDSSAHCYPSGSCWTDANYVLIDHGDGSAALYLHLKQGSVLAQVGQSIGQGQSLGTADNSGWSSGPHLHFQAEKTPCTAGTPPVSATCKQQAGWWWNYSLKVTFSDRDVVVKAPNGIPQAGVFYVSDNHAVGPTQPVANTTTVPVVACPTDAAMPQPTPVPSSSNITLPNTGLPPLALYADNQLSAKALAPSGWNCQAAIGVDGGEGLSIWPPDANPSPGQSAQQGIFVSYQPACQGCIYYMVCGLLPQAVTDLASLYGECNHKPPIGESHQALSESAASFEDPAGVAGMGTASGGAQTAIGIVVFHSGGPSAASTAAVETCVLPAAQRSFCSALLADFQSRFVHQP